MSILDAVVTLLLTTTPFGPVAFSATPDGPDHVIVEFMNPEPHVVVRFDRQLRMEVIQGEIVKCEPEKEEEV